MVHNLIRNRTQILLSSLCFTLMGENRNKDICEDKGNLVSSMRQASHPKAPTPSTRRGPLLVGWGGGGGGLHTSYHCRPDQIVTLEANVNWQGENVQGIGTASVCTADPVISHLLLW